MDCKEIMFFLFMYPGSLNNFISMRIWIRPVTVEERLSTFHFLMQKTRRGNTFSPFWTAFLRSSVSAARSGKIYLLHDDSAHVSSSIQSRILGYLNSCIKQWFGSLCTEYVSDPDPGFLVIPDPSGPYPGF